MERKNRKPKGYWYIKKNVIEESKKYKTRTSFKINSETAYNSALKNNWIDEMNWLDKNSNKLPKGY